MISTGINSGQATRFLKNAGKRMHKALSESTRDELAIIQRRHKKQEINRGKNKETASGRWTSRTGELSKSFHIDWKKGDITGAYGSALPRAAKVEEGGKIKARKGYLAIPTENAPDGVWPRYIKGLVFVQSLKGQPLLVKPKGDEGDFDVFFILRRQVKLDPRPSMANAIKNTEKVRAKVTMAHIDKALGAGDAQ